MVKALSFKLGGQGIKSLVATPLGLPYPTCLLSNISIIDTTLFFISCRLY